MRYQDVVARDSLAATSPAPSWIRWLAVVLVGGGLLCGGAAIVVVLLGRQYAFDASGIAWPLGIAAIAMFVSMSLVARFHAYVFRWRAITDPDWDIPEVPHSEVPERDAIRAAQARAIARRIRKRRAGRG